MCLLWFKERIPVFLWKPVFFRWPDLVTSPATLGCIAAFKCSAVTEGVCIRATHQTENFSASEFALPTTPPLWGLFPLHPLLSRDLKTAGVIFLTPMPFAIFGCQSFARLNFYGRFWPFFFRALTSKWQAGVLIGLKEFILQTVAWKVCDCETINL